MQGVFSGAQNCGLKLCRVVFRNFLVGYFLAVFSVRRSIIRGSVGKIVGIRIVLYLFGALYYIVDFIQKIVLRVILVLLFLIKLCVFFFIMLVVV